MMHFEACDQYDPLIERIEKPCNCPMGEVLAENARLTEQLAHARQIFGVARQARDAALARVKMLEAVVEAAREARRSADWLPSGSVLVNLWRKIDALDEAQGG
jgi:hypothetical protein